MTCCPVPLLPDREPDQAAAPASSGRGLDAAFGRCTERCRLEAPFQVAADYIVTSCIFCSAADNRYLDLGLKPGIQF